MILYIAISNNIMKIVYFKDEDPDDVYLVLEELENSYILGL